MRFIQSTTWNTESDGIILTFPHGKPAFVPSPNGAEAGCKQKTNGQMSTRFFR